MDFELEKAKTCYDAARKFFLEGQNKVQMMERSLKALETEYFTQRIRWVASCQATF